VRQALDNLLDNATRHARTEVRVELTALPGRELVLVVDDDGPGIERGMLPRLFDAFAQGPGRAGTAGMGLATVRAVAEAHGGGISVGRAETGGARFTLRLPLTPVETIAP
jgi:signal transduction histidine kinase